MMRHHRRRGTAVALKEMFFRLVIMLMLSMEVCWGSDPPKSYGPSSSKDSYQNNYEPEIQRPLAVFTERPVNVANFVLIPVVQVPSSDLRVIYRPQIDSVSKTEPIVMCKSLTKSIEATPAVQVPLQQPFYLYDEYTVIPFPKTVTILHGGYRMSIPVGVVVAPVPVGVLRSGPVFVTTLYAIPASPLPTPLPFRFVPYQPAYPAPQSYSVAGPPSPYTQAGPPSPYSPAGPSSPYSSSGPSSSYSPAGPSHTPAGPSHTPAGPSYSHPAPPSPYLPAAPPSPPLYSHSVSQYSHPASQYSHPVPPAPTYYSNSGGDYSEDGPPGKLYSQLAATTFQNSKESPLLQQLREESEKNRKKYVPPSFSNQYQTIDA
ncbi:extensin-like isoform X2 [Sipha flava]|uniref:Extensin-like isoform X2 n=2 Tax=Sipha flava TaxID=143950 RepID=A0A8B8G7T8_9HEMI|nr:extensin-like isoform X2 [Sipha flava]